MTGFHQAQALLSQPARADRPQAPWLAVAGGKGGVGKTVIAVNLAILAARQGYRTLLVDLDPGLANVDVHLRLAPRYTIEDLARGTCSPAEATMRGPAGIGVLAGRSGSIALAGGDRNVLDQVHRAVERAAQGYDLVICDTGAGVGPAVLQTARRADVALAVTCPEPAAVTDAYALIKLMVQGGDAPPQLVVNRVRNREQALRAGARLSSVCSEFLGVSMPLGGWLRQDAAVERAVAEQRPFAVDGSGPVVEDLRSLVGNVLSNLPSHRSD